MIKLVQKDHKKVTLNENLKLIKYAKEQYGSILFMPWLKVYFIISGKFPYDCIPDNYMDYYVLPKINKNYRMIAKTKTLTKRILNTDLLNDEFFVINKHIYDKDMQMINFDILMDTLMRNRKKYIVKRDDSSGSQHIYIINFENFDKQKLINFGDSVIQRMINQDEEYLPLSQTIATTLRVSTLLDDKGYVKVIGSYVRLYYDHSDIFNPNRKIRIMVKSNGQLNEIGHNEKYMEISINPLSNTPLNQYCIPHINEAYEVCIKLHKQIPQFSYIGWDIAFDKDEGIRLLEWNTQYPNITYLESVSGPIFKDQLWNNIWKENGKFRF